MIYRRFSEKEEAVFEGIMELLRNGNNPYKITVSEIAKSANIGKGTVYDYFSSKEEAISMALIYNIQKDIATVKNLVIREDTFRDKYFKIINLLQENIENKYSTLSLATNYKELDEIFNHDLDTKRDPGFFITELESIFSIIIDKGIEEKIIYDNETKYYQISAVRSSISGYLGYISHRECFPNIDEEYAKDVSYKQLIKMLK